MKRAPASGSATVVTHSSFQAAHMRLEQIHGILVDGGLSGGSGSHNGHSGVNYYLDGGNETFGVNGPGETWCSLEILIAGGSRLAGGRKVRFCIDTPSTCTAVRSLSSTSSA